MWCLECILGLKAPSAVASWSRAKWPHGLETTQRFGMPALNSKLQKAMLDCFSRFLPAVRGDLETLEAALGAKVLLRCRSHTSASIIDHIISYSISPGFAPAARAESRQPGGSRIFGVRNKQNLVWRRKKEENEVNPTRSYGHTSPTEGRCFAKAIGVRFVAAQAAQGIVYTEAAVGKVLTDPNSCGGFCEHGPLPLECSEMGFQSLR